MSNSRELHCILVGAGPAGMGALVAALQTGRFERILSRGIAVVEGSDRIGSGSLGNYSLRSDSPASSFLECPEAGPARTVLGHLLDRPHVRTLLTQREAHVPLELVARLLEEVAHAMRGVFERFPESRFLAGHFARSLEATRQGTWRVKIESSTGVDSVLKARHVVLALGARQVRTEALESELIPDLRLDDRWAQRVMLSGELLSKEGRLKLRRTLERAGSRARVVVIGSSHSAFSSAVTALEVAQGLPLQREAITIAYRNRLRVFYPSPQQARSDGYREFGPEDVCPRTGRLHRLGGLRGDGRELCRASLGLGGLAPDERVRLTALRTFHEQPQVLRELLESATCIVPAFGYRARTLPARDGQGDPIRLEAFGQRRLVDAASRVLDSRGRIVPGLMGIGLASGYLPEGEASFRGHTNGVWLYQNDTGATLLRGIGV